MNLNKGALLQGGKYRIEGVLGQGGFGITYLAVQSGLNRKVAIKEFFMKDLCNRDADTSHVSVPSVGSKELVDRFKNKFIKEAQTIASLDNPHIIPIYDIFEENGTAYYVMKFFEGGSLLDLVSGRGRLTEADALTYIRQIADALQYIHERSMNHLDVKPGNVLLDEKGNAVLIDFGLAKRYDTEGNQTSTTPVGISHGYAPLEQYKKGGVSMFSPTTDIYSLGATFYKLITGKTPPEADDVNEDGLPAFPSDVSPLVAVAIERAMQPVRRKRLQSVAEFLALLDAPTSVIPSPSTSSVESENDDMPQITQIGDVLDEKPTEFPVSAPEKHNKISANIDFVTEKNEKEVTNVNSGKKILFLVVFLLAIIIFLNLFIGWFINNDNDRGYVNDNKFESSGVVDVDGNMVFTVNGVEFKMVAVQGGTFDMGADIHDWCLPVHEVTLDDYYIGETEVTQELWQTVMGSNPSFFTGNLQRPVEEVSWDDCQIFIGKLNELTNGNFRLPTEAEWEYAARGGFKSKGYKYSGSNIASDVAWYEENSCGSTHSVKEKLPNELGLYDMSGNVTEWCQDWAGDYNSSSQINPCGENYGLNERIRRGGYWSNSVTMCHSSARDCNSPDKTYNFFGLRLAQTNSSSVK